ncbi:hypothetical protein JCM18901_2021 [Psychrobacter sp. JCM 18901]|nr:hypothetical protein JCM18901_2021 [Psychrobacter sp. JCM 18901]
MSNHTDLPSNNEDSTQSLGENTDIDLSQNNIEVTEETDSIDAEDIALDNDMAIEEFFAPSGNTRMLMILEQVMWPLLDDQMWASQL